MIDVVELVEQAARGVYWDYKRYVELEDVTQECWLEYLKKRNRYERLLMDPSTLKYVKYSIRKAGATYARREMWERMRIHPEDQYRYSKPEIRLLVEMYLGGDWAGDRLKDERIDLERGWAALAYQDQMALEFVYGTREVKLTGVDRMRASRAIRRLQGVMCGKPEDCDWEPASDQAKRPEMVAEPRS